MKFSRIALGAAVLALAVTLIPAALAGKNKPGGGGSGGTTGGTSSLTGPVLVTDLNGNGVVNHGDSINFNVSTTATAKPEVGVRCYQGSNWIYDGYVGYWPDYMFTPYFTLDSGYWASGVSASCTARLFYYDSRGREQVLATSSFTVAP
jgi:hypothetical protein